LKIQFAKVLFFLVLLFEALGAHQTGLSFISVDETSPQEVAVFYKKPLSDLGGDAISIVYPKGCVKLTKVLQNIQNGFILRNYKMSCLPQGLMGKRIWIEGLLSKDRGVMIKYVNGDFKQTALLRASTPFMHIQKENPAKLLLFYEYLLLGIEHIWSGYDHLLFVLSLFLLSATFKKLLWSISGFTLAHSVTLAFGIFGIIDVGVAYIEAMIALSIIFLSREILSSQNTLTKRYLGIIAFVFGLLHGLGFATVLKTIGLPQNEIPLSLLAFNLGIEFGQVLFIILVGAILYFLKKYSQSYRVMGKSLLAYIIGTLATYWFLERILAF
jgi:hydrogenase/urease accessory protein HupE